MAALAGQVPTAGAVVVRTTSGQFAGVTPRSGVSLASSRTGLARVQGRSGFSSNGNLDYQGGPVLHGSAPWLVFWDPNNEISAGQKALYARYFTDTAGASGQATNVFSVDRQFTDGTGSADYQQVFSSSQIITDSHAYPTTGNCSRNNSGAWTCLFDSQLQAEVARLRVADGLPTGITGNAPIYFVVTPPDTNVCFDNATCADNFFCAYHSSFTSGGSTILYSSLPSVLLVTGPKGCQSDGNAQVQEPNGLIEDVAIKYASHEFSETITDPTGLGWWDSNSGNEDGDNCNRTGAFNPQSGSNPDAFLPTLGGSASAGTLFNQVINGDHYYTQSEWSNGDVNCEMQPSTGAISPVFTAPAAALEGAAISLDPSASTSSKGFTSQTWSFGDGTQSFSRGGPAPVSHTYAAPGVYTVTLTLIDTRGNLSTVSHAVAIHGPQRAAFSVTAANPAAGQAVGFDGSASSDPGATITSYTWNFGDGSAAGSGPTTSHAYNAPGTYTVTLTITDSFGSQATSSQPVTIDELPVASFKSKPKTRASGVAVRFDGTGSSDPDGTILKYFWNFGDHNSATSATPKHTYKRRGHYSVTLTVTDSNGLSSSVTQTVVVAKAAKIAKVFTGHSHGQPVLEVKVTGPGTVKVGSKRVRLRNRGVAKFRLHAGRQTVKITFTPVAGRVQHKTVHVTV